MNQAFCDFYAFGLYVQCARYELSTTEGWVDVTLAAVDSTGIDMQPVANTNEAWAFFFIAFMLVGSFFFMNLFVGVLYERFVQAQASLQVPSAVRSSQF